MSTFLNVESSELQNKKKTVQIKSETKGRDLLKKIQMSFITVQEHHSILTGSYTLQEQLSILTGSHTLKEEHSLLTGSYTLTPKGTTLNSP